MFSPHFFDESLLGEEEEIGEFVAHFFNIAVAGEMQEDMSEFMASRESESFYCSLLWTHIYNYQWMTFISKRAKSPNVIRQFCRKNLNALSFFYLCTQESS